MVPSYLFGAGRGCAGLPTWSADGAVPGVGVIAAVLVGFNQNLLLRMQEGTPTTFALCGILCALWHMVGASNLGQRPDTYGPGQAQPAGQSLVALHWA